jgi:glycosyltransferase involved in cell wall biosynthesis
MPEISNTEKRLKILYLPRWYPHKYDPMPGLFIERHARSVSPHCDMAVLYVHPDDQLDKKYESVWLQDEELLQLKIYFPTAKSGPSLLKRILNQWSFFKAHLKGRKLMREKFGKADVIHVNVLTRLGVLAYLNKLSNGTPYVITEHWTRYLPMTDTYHGWLRKLATRIVVKNASAVLPVTDNLRRAMEDNGLKNKNYVIIPNVVNTEMFHLKEGPVSGDRMKFVHVSCFEDKQKNISGMLKVLKRLSESRQDWECHMIGEGIHYDQLVEQAGKLGIKDQFVIFHGLKENEELAELIRDAYFQVMFSRFENLPVVILESYASGVPVLSTDVGGIYEHMNKDLGRLIPSEDEEALYRELNEMLDHHDQYDKNLIREYALSHFSREVIGKQLSDIYHQVAV